MEPCARWQPEVSVLGEHVGEAHRGYGHARARMGAAVTRHVTIRCSSSAALADEEFTNRGKHSDCQFHLAWWRCCNRSLSAASAGFGRVTVRRLDQVLGAAKLKTLLARDQPGLFAAIGELDWYSGSHRQWIDDLDIRACGRVLEVGCATGTLTSYLADTGYRVTGVDRSDDMIRRGRSDHPELDLSVGDAMMLPYEDDAFDAVIAASVVNVVDDAGAVLTEMHRVCAPGGTVSMLVPSASFTNEDFDTLLEKLGLTGFSQAALTKWHGSAPKMGRSQIETLFRSAELELADTHSYLDGMAIAATASARPD